MMVTGLTLLAFLVSREILEELPLGLQDLFHPKTVYLEGRRAGRGILEVGFGGEDRARLSLELRAKLRERRRGVHRWRLRLLLDLSV